MAMFHTVTSRFGAAFLLALSVSALGGCDKKEKVLDIETPGGEVEVERDRDTGETEVKVDDNE